MTDTPGYVAVINGSGVPVNEAVNQTVLGSTPAIMPFLAPWCNGNPVTVSNPLPVATKDALYTLVALDASTLPTAGTAVTVLLAGHTTAGGFIVTNNPSGMYVNQLGTANSAGGGSNIFVAQGQVYAIAPTLGAVSVVSSSANVSISGYGYT